MAASEGQIRETLGALEQSLRAGLPLTRTEWTMGLPPKLAGPLKAAVNAGRPLAESLFKVLGLFPYERLLLEAGEGAGSSTEFRLAVSLAGLFTKGIGSLRQHIEPVAIGTDRASGEPLVFFIDESSAAASVIRLIS